MNNNINEGFFGNIGAGISEVITTLREKIEEAFNAIDWGNKVKRVIPEAVYTIDTNNQLHITSKIDPNIKYDFDIDAPIHEICNRLNEFCSNTTKDCFKQVSKNNNVISIKPKPLTLDTIDWDEIWIGYDTKKNDEPISISVNVDKDNLYISFKVSTLHIYSRYSTASWHTFHVPTTEYKYIPFYKNGKMLRMSPYNCQLTTQLIDNPIMVYMDLQNYISKNIKALKSGNANAMDIKVGIEDYLKRIK